MARYLPDNYTNQELDLKIELVNPAMAEVYYTPPADELCMLDGDVGEYKTHIATFYIQYSCISIYPIITLFPHTEYLKPKYTNIREIVVHMEDVELPESSNDVEAQLLDLPSGFVKDIRYGLGLTKEYRFIIDAVERFTECSMLEIGSDKETGESEGCFYLSWSDYEDMRKVCNRLTNRARKAARLTKERATYNHLALRLGRPQKTKELTNDVISRMLRLNISPSDKQSALELVTQDRSAISASTPETLGKLRSDIELVTLERLIEQFEELLGKRTKEDTWQKLFNENPFILSLTFGYPAIKVRDQASVGGKRLSGNGEKIADYLLKNRITNNLAIVEIKKPSTQLLHKSVYRGSVYSASADLSGSVTQVLDQRYHLEQNIASIKMNSRVYDIESYAINCVLVIGMLPSDDDMRKSLELYRRNSKDVHIVTFDELLLKLKQLMQFLSSEDVRD
ncbi:Shedu immune nuclease family protein [Vibrio sp. F74]|uniref:Shedu immune nuclease family protein n=1 Tax=Vibrio sp. F74 TaxID=700020 RepID=UPI0035F5E86A